MGSKLLHEVRPLTTNLFQERAVRIIEELCDKEYKFCKLSYDENLISPKGTYFRVSWYVGTHGHGYSVPLGKVCTLFTDSLITRNEFKTYNISLDFIVMQPLDGYIKMCSDWHILIGDQKHCLQYFSDRQLTSHPTKWNLQDLTEKNLNDVDAIISWSGDVDRTPMWGSSEQESVFWVSFDMFISWNFPNSTVSQ